MFWYGLVARAGVSRFWGWLLSCMPLEIHQAHCAMVRTMAFDNITTVNNRALIANYLQANHCSSDPVQVQSSKFRHCYVASLFSMSNQLVPTFFWATHGQLQKFGEGINSSRLQPRFLYTATVITTTTAISTKTTIASQNYYPPPPIPPQTQLPPQFCKMTVEVCTSQKFRKSHWCVPFTATFSKRRKIGALWSERCDVVPCPKQNYTCFACGLNDGRPFERMIPECCTFTHKTDTNLQFNNSYIYTYLCQQIFATVYMGYVCFSQRHGILKLLQCGAYSMSSQSRSGLARIHIF